MPTPLEPHAVIVGGGVIGVCCAYFLAKRGARVTVLERDEVGRGASYGNAGTIAPGHPPINKPGSVRRALRSMLDPTSPLYIPPRWDPKLVRWLWTFAASCTKAQLDRSMQVLAPLGRATRALFDQLVDGEALDCDYRRDGYYEVFVTERGGESATTDAATMRRYGYHPQMLSGAAVREREPALHDRVLGGIYYPEAATVSPYRFVLEMAERARRHGAAFRTASEVMEVLARDARVWGVRTRDGEMVTADCVVLATGANSLRLTRQLGYQLPLQAAKGYHRDRDPRAGGTPKLRYTCMLSEASVFCTPMDSVVRFAGTLEFSGVNHEIRRPRLEQLTEAAKRYLNGMDDVEAGTEWCGLRPCMADGLPVVGPAPRHMGLFIATGHAMLGLTLGPITGRLVAEYVLDGTPSMDVWGLRPDRF